MRKKLQQLKNFFISNRLFVISLLWLFFLPIYSGEILANSHAYIFGKYINYLHIRVSLHLILSITIVVFYLQKTRLNISAKKVILFLVMLLLPLFSVQLLPTNDQLFLYLSAYFHLVEFFFSVVTFYIATKEIFAHMQSNSSLIFRTISGAVALQFLLGITQYFLGGPLFPTLLSWTGQPIEFTSNSSFGIWEYSRVYGTTPHPNILAAILIFFDLIVLSLKIPKIQKIIFLILSTLLILTTLSKAGILALIALLFIYSTRNKIYIHEKYFIPIFLVTNAMLIFFFHYIPKLGITATFIESRFTIHLLYLELLQQFPVLLLTGTGFTLSIPTLLAHASTIKTSIIWGNQILAEPPHNVAILSIVELGIPATIAVLYLIQNNISRLLLGFENWQKLSLLAMLIILGGVDHYLVY